MFRNLIDALVFYPSEFSFFVKLTSIVFFLFLAK